jgi:hypothetical protein
MLGDDIRARVRVLVTDLDQNPAPLVRLMPAAETFLSYRDQVVGTMSWPELPAVDTVLRWQPGRASLRGGRLQPIPASESPGVGAATDP